MSKKRKWWKIPLIISCVLGFVPVMTLVTILFMHRPGSRYFGDRVLGSITIIIILMILIWGSTFMILGIRKLIRRARDGKKLQQK